MNSSSRRFLPFLAVAIAVAVGGLVVARIAGADSSATTSQSVDRRFVRLVAAYVAPNEAVIDEVVLVPGDHQDGAYRIDNPDPTTDSLPVAGDVVVTRVDCSGDDGCVEGVVGDYDTLTLSVAEATIYAELTVEDGWIVRIDERYLA